MKIKESVRRITPRFILEGYAKHENDKPWAKIIGAKDDAPQWAHDEYKAILQELEENYKEAE